MVERILLLVLPQVTKMYLYFILSCPSTEEAKNDSFVDMVSNMCGETFCFFK